MNSEWLRDAIRFSLKATPRSSISSIDNGPGPPMERDPRFRKLVEGILYSRRFILIYHLVVLSFIAALSVVYWSKKALRWRRRTVSAFPLLGQEEDIYRPRSRPETFDTQDCDATSSSGSSTILGTASPPSKDVVENTPLLRDTKAPRLKYPRRSVLSSINALLMYQPRPIPLFKKTLPPNGSSITLLAFISLNIFYTFFHVNFNIFELFILADRCGLVFVANLPLLYTLAAKNQPLKFLTGQSYESLNIYHRRLGELLCLEAILHAVGMAGVWYTLLRPAGFTLANFLFNRVILLGLSAFISYEVLYFTSLAMFRQSSYELFLGLHVLLQIAALVFVFFHHPGSRIYVGAAIAIICVDRLVYRLGMKSTTVEADACILDDGETVKLSAIIIKRPGSALFKFLGRSVTAGWKATDHVFVSVPALGSKHLFQAHPFTIASAAPIARSVEAKLDLLIRAQTGFSAELLEMVRLHNRLTVRIDGPYGSPHARTMLENSDMAIVVAGGSGIAVAWPLVHHLRDINRCSDVEVAPSSKSRRRKIVLVWVVHNGSHISWIGRRALVDVEKYGVNVIIPQPTEEIGRPDLKYMIDEMINDFCGSERKRIAVVGSGPDSMGRDIRNTCARLVRAGRNVDVAIEKFGW